MDARIGQLAQKIQDWWWQTFNGSWDAPTEHYLCPSDRQRHSTRLDVLNLWTGAPNWHTMTDLNRRYLQRRLPICPSYTQPPDTETRRFTNLLRLHEYGIISTSSCPGWEQTFSRQRAYLYFSIPTRNLTTSPGVRALDAVLDFVRRLRNSQEIYAHIRFQYDITPPGVERNQQFSELMPYGACNTLPDDHDNVWKHEEWELVHDEDQNICSYLFANAQTRRKVEGGWEVTGYYGMATRGSAFCDDDDHFPASEAADPLQIAVIARDWEYKGIGELIEQLLIKSGISPVFMAE